MFSFILLIIFITLSALKYFKINFIYLKLWRLVTGTKYLPELVKEIYDAHPNLSQVSILFGKKPTIILRDLKNIHAVLHGNFESFYARDIPTNATDVLSDNLLFVDDFLRWKLIRQKFSPLLSTSTLKNVFYITERCARDFVNFIDENLQIIGDPYEVIHTYTAASIGFNVFGLDQKIESTMKTPLSKIAYRSQPILSFKLSYFLAKVSPKLYKWLNLKVSGAYEDSFIEIVKKAIEKRRSNKEIHHDFIDTCLKFEDQGQLKDYVTGYETDVTLQFLAAQAFVYFVGGVDTITTVLHFTLLELSNDSNILQKLHEEIDKLFQNNGGSLSFKDLDKLEYTEMVLNESMRKYPPVGLAQRRCCKDTILPIGNVSIKKGTNVVIPIFALHRDNKYFPNSDVFNPERFSPKNLSKIVKYSFMPFGEGKRMCIGLRLAFMEMKTCLAWLLRKYTLKKQSYTPKYFDPSVLILRDPNARYQMIPRSLP